MQLGGRDIVTQWMVRAMHVHTFIRSFPRLEQHARRHRVSCTQEIFKLPASASEVSMPGSWMRVPRSAKLPTVGTSSSTRAGAAHAPGTGACMCASPTTACHILGPALVLPCTVGTHVCTDSQAHACLCGLNCQRKSRHLLQPPPLCSQQPALQAAVCVMPEPCSGSHACHVAQLL